MTLIADTTAAYWGLGRKLKHTQKGWISGNAVCCHHNGTTADTRGRAGLMINGDSVTWHCFNCGYKCSWQPGMKLSTKFKNLLRWLSVPDDIITKCTFEALRTSAEITEQNTKFNVGLPTFHTTHPPIGAKPIIDWIQEDPIPEQLIQVIEYLFSRNLSIDDFNWMWTDQPGFNDRVIIPFYYQTRLVGYTARKIKPGKPKYISDQQPGYVFNLDRQHYKRKFVVVTEGPIDAICVDGVSLMGSEIQAGQQVLINHLNKKVIVVPDRDSASEKLVDQAIKQNWSVSFPDWEDPTIKDVNDAVKKFGKVLTLKKIIESTKSTPVTIQVAAKLWFKGSTQ